ncbi:carbohydrate ABC transporter permease [Methylophaga sp. OBS4]|uniref:carbohydrate ABC transporter permease n=1 Tax=Methylophaga sp. OBS4 TaxID=2991935 RepID=UPI00225318E3|nr:carbohydrate ABC transporter permease [Methylophaga sp. OBS4]MCX4188011.1 carbohydrate ABC transporter permease [Methylophaga sp. OBS4]
MKYWLQRSFNYLFLTLAALLFLAPVVMMLVGSLKPDQQVFVEAGSLSAFIPGEASLDNYADVFARSDFLRFLFNSLFITGTIVIAGLLVNSLAAYAFARLQWRGRDLLFNLVLALMILPLEAIAVPLFYQVAVLGLRDTYTAQILPFIANTFAIYLFYSFFIGLPRELEEAARLDGASTLRIFFSIIVPNSKPVFASVTILTFLLWWGSYLWPLMVTIGPEVRPLPVAIASFYTLPPLQWGDILAFGVMMVSPVLLIFLLFQRWFVRGVAASAIKG